MSDSKEPIKRSLKDWLDEFYQDTGTLSGLIRNLGLAGIGIIWIFKNSDLNQKILPPLLISPLRFLVLCLIADVLQYLWRAISIYMVYKFNEIQHRRKKITDEDIADIQVPEIIPIFTWLFFTLKIILAGIAYYQIYNFIVGRL